MSTPLEPPMATSPVRASWELSTPASPAETWALFSDTERYNRAAGFDFRFEETPEPDGGTRRRGSARFLGMDVRWEELPFQYRTGQWYRWERRFLGSPGERLVGTLRLKPQGEGTAILYTLEAWPRSVFFKPAVAFELLVRSKPKIDRALDQMLALLRGDDVLLEPAPEPLAPEARDRLQAMAGRIPDPDFARQLVRLIEEAPLSQQDSLSPLALARSWGLPQERAVHGCLEAVRAGALTLSWDLLCPLCLSPKQKLARLSQAGEVHCPACNIHYDGTFADSVSVRFRTSPALRRFEVHSSCIGSPARQPHVVAQDRLEPGAEAVFELPLEPGLYRLRSFPSRDSASISVGESGPVGLTVPIGGEAPFSGRLELQAGPCRIAVQSQASRPVLVMLERRTLPPDVLTAGQLLEDPAAHDLLPPEAVEPGACTVTARRALLAVEIPDQRPERLREESESLLAQGAAMVQARSGLLLAAFDAALPALQTARALHARTPCRLALGLGPVLELTFAEGRRGLMGRAVDRTLVALWGSSPGRAAIDAELASDGELMGALMTLGLRLEPRGLQVASDERVHSVPL